jgi:hypothetical protein
MNRLKHSAQEEKEDKQGPEFPLPPAPPLLHNCIMDNQHLTASPHTKCFLRAPKQTEQTLKPQCYMSTYTEIARQAVLGG